MNKNLTTIETNTKVALNRTKSLLSLKNKLITKDKKTDLIDDAWIERLWEWADENDVHKDKLPRDKEKLLNLTELDLYDNQLTELPKEIVNLTNLTKLDLSYNNLQELPETIRYLTNLIELNLDTNPMEDELPKEIINLKKLKEINLCYTLISKIPRELFNLISLEKIYYNTFADMYPIKELPNGINNLINLKIFHFQSAGLKKLPKEIGNLINLAELDLRNNPNLILTQEQKEWIKELENNGCKVYIDDDLLEGTDTSLSEIKVDDSWIDRLWKWADENEISDLEYGKGYHREWRGFPRDKEKLLKLKELNLTGNSLKELAKEIVNLTNLTTLSLSINHFTELPNEIINLTNLTELNLKYNSNLILTKEQKEWIKELETNGCNVYIDDDLLDRSLSNQKESIMTTNYKFTAESNLPESGFTIEQAIATYTAEKLVEFGHIVEIDEQIF